MHAQWKVDIEYIGAEPRSRHTNIVQDNHYYEGQSNMWQESKSRCDTGNMFCVMQDVEFGKSVHYWQTKGMQDCG